MIVAGLVVHYPGRVIGPFSLSRDVGIVRLEGPNGSGKTTILRAMCASIPRSAGTVTLHGEDPETTASARARIGFVPAEPELPGFLTIGEAWRMMADLRLRPDWDGTALLRLLDLSPDVRMDRASTGMRRKAEVVAALAGDPEVILLDETLANIDVRGQDALIGWLDEHRRDRLVVLTHHGPCPLQPDETVTLG